jgi:hypothetical protein
MYDYNLWAVAVLGEIHSFRPGPSAANPRRTAGLDAILNGFIISSQVERIIKKSCLAIKRLTLILPTRLK